MSCSLIATVRQVYYFPVTSVDFKSSLFERSDSFQNFIEKSSLETELLEIEIMKVLNGIKILLMFFYYFDFKRITILLKIYEKILKKADLLCM